MVLAQTVNSSPTLKGWHYRDSIDWFQRDFRTFIMRIRWHDGPLQPQQVQHEFHF
tara:strand:- start:332 stop:496 length:165 start_codon:yes stop_codon:yes gene_type:complete